MISYDEGYERGRADEHAHVERLERTLRNVLKLAQRMKRYGAGTHDADHLIRFCVEAGVQPAVLREDKTREMISSWPRGSVSSNSSLRLSRLR